MKTITLPTGTELITYPFGDPRPWKQTLDKDLTFKIVRETSRSLYLTLNVPYQSNYNNCRVERKNLPKKPTMEQVRN